MDSEILKQYAVSAGATVARIADLARLRGIETMPPDLLDGFRYAVSLAVALSDPIIETITDRPTPIYAAHYQRVNALLDEAALRVSRYVEELGGRAMPLPASQVLDVRNNMSFLSHKAVAVAAGIGWQGKSLLTVSPQYGPRIRLVSILVDADLTPDEPLKNRCGSCTRCTDACPAGAIRNVNTESHYASREEALHFERCVHHVREVCAKMENIGTSICGVCIKVCPWGAKKRAPAA
ncbi:4Fe-4S ferredoxin iron-sulfur binding domain protein [Pseudodesulfovibrio mercurii]|uniref:4Fe-4S ferredoxin iron-sulfur binding domain protein n=1 Tax=Pseudodesulfovibrio mercurii TaxID=641491 RepID=F0JD56_9BACT|nr:4Fe-4S double cluster binding domain-containing protein [Pseudodesulfovibrio mercurii]EGB14548.1 4Fe-4S ferredoxin iron-sulfur binding domain protein [Pseudodesulfovibrio mercurii]